MPGLQVGLIKTPEDKVLRPEEIRALFEHLRASSDPTHRFLIGLQYLLGLRVGEVVRLRPEHLRRNTVHGLRWVSVPTQPSGDDPATFRLVDVPVLTGENHIVAAFHPDRGRAASPWLFPGRDPARHIRTDSAVEAFKRACWATLGGNRWATSSLALRNSAGRRVLEATRDPAMVRAFLRLTGKAGRRRAAGQAVPPSAWPPFRGCLGLPGLAAGNS